MKAMNHVQAGTAAPAVHDLLTRAATMRARPGIVRMARSFVVLGGAAALTGALLAALAPRHALPEDSAGVDTGAFVRVWALSLPICLALFARYRLYHARHISTRRDELTRIVHAIGLGVVALA